MKKKQVIFSTILVTSGLFSFQKITGGEAVVFFEKNGFRHPSGVTSSVTGAPGDANCTACHSGATQAGSSVNSLVVSTDGTPVTSYALSTTYDVELGMSPNPSKRGFQAIALGDGNVMAGTFSAGVGTQVITSGTKKRVTHTTNGNNGSAPWSWTWTSPDTDLGNVTFYVATMAANNNGSNSGDVVYLSQHPLGSTAVISEPLKDQHYFSAGYAVSSHSIVMNFNSLTTGDLFVNLVDLNGRSVFTYSMGQAQIGGNSEKIVVPTDLKNGVFVVHLFIGNTAMSQKIMIQQ
jgi:hypothetical protein